MNECCKGCWKWERFAEGCWVHWENKRECSHFAGSQEEDLNLELQETSSKDGQK